MSLNQPIERKIAQAPCCVLAIASERRRMDSIVQMLLLFGARQARGHKGGFLRRAGAGRQGVAYYLPD